MVAFEKELMAHPADIVLVVGDVTSTMACSIVAKKLNTKVCHVEAGIRSWDLTMPEEINRMVTDSLADYMFTTSDVANANLVRMGCEMNKNVWFVGNVMIDTLLADWQSVADKFRPQLQRLLLSGDIDRLRQRVEAAVLYYLPLLGMAAVQVANHPCRSKNKADAADFETWLSDLYLVLHQKIHLMKALSKAERPCADTILQARNGFAAPMAELNPVMEKPQRKAKKTKATVSDKLTPQAAGERWMIEDDYRLYALHNQGKKAGEIAQILSRSYGAIKARLKKFGLI